MLPESIRATLIEVARRLAGADVEFLLGGSARLRLAGIDVPVNDIDLVVRPDDKERVEEALRDFDVRQQTSFEPWRSEWLLVAGAEVGSDVVGVDVIGGLGLDIDGGTAWFPFEADSAVPVGDSLVPLVPLAHWYHLYRVHNPEKAGMVAAHLSDDEIVDAAGALGIGEVFSPTLIVRIGNGLLTNGIEEGMSNDVQTSMIEVASPTDQVFDEPGTEIIDRALLDETLEYIRPALQADGGDLILLGTQGGKVTLQMVGACGGCPLSTMTLTAGIERILQDRVPGVTEVVAQ